MLRSIWSISSLLIGMGLLLVGSGLLGMVIGLRGVYEGFSNLMIGLIMSGYYVGYIAGAWICPTLIRRVGHVRCFASFAALSAALTLAFGMVVDPWVWLVLRVFNGLALMGIYMVIESWLNERSQATPGSQASIFAVYMVVNLASELGPRGRRPMSAMAASMTGVSRSAAAWNSWSSVVRTSSSWTSWRWTVIERGASMPMRGKSNAFARAAAPAARWSAAFG